MLVNPAVSVSSDIYKHQQFLDAFRFAPPKNSMKPENSDIQATFCCEGRSIFRFHICFHLKSDLIYSSGSIPSTVKHLD